MREAMDEKEVSDDWWSSIPELAPLKLEALSMAGAKARMEISGRGDYVIVPRKGSIRIGSESPNSLNLVVNYVFCNSELQRIFLTFNVYTLFLTFQNSFLCKFQNICCEILGNLRMTRRC